MKKNLFKVTALTFILALSLTFTGCGSKATPVEKFLNTSDAKSFAAQYSSADYSVELDSADGNVLVLRFTSTAQLDITDDVVSLMDQALDSQSSVMSTAVSQIGDAIGEDNLVVRFVYVNADGKEFLTKDFK